MSGDPGGQGAAEAEAGEGAAGPVVPRSGHAVLPGDQLGESKSVHAVRAGPGVAWDGEALFATQAGTARWAAERPLLWVDDEKRRYVPKVGDHVIGIVESKHVEEYKLNVGGPSAAILPVLAFDGATKRNRPHLEVGALVYARIEHAHDGMEPEATCAAPPGVSAKDWVTKESIFGELEGGHASCVPQSLARQLMGESDVLAALERIRTPFEMAVGVNGRVWLSSTAVGAVVEAQRVVEAAADGRAAPGEDDVLEVEDGDWRGEGGPPRKARRLS